MMSKVLMLIGGVVILLSPNVAYSYIDPGAGLLILQFIMSAIGGAIIIYRNTVTGFLKRLFKKKKE